MALHKILWRVRLVPLAVSCVLFVQSVSATALTPLRLYLQSTQETDIIFTSLASGSGMTEDGSQFSFWLAKSSDGVGISARTERRRSVARAQGQLDKQIKGARIVARGRKTNNQGERVGERVAGCFPSKNQEKGKCVILWTDGSELHVLEAASLPHLLAFEKKYYGAQSPDD